MTGLAVVVAALFFALGDPRQIDADHGFGQARRRGERPDQRVSHYRASGVLPRWD